VSHPYLQRIQIRMHTHTRDAHQRNNMYEPYQRFHGIIQTRLKDTRRVKAFVVGHLR